MPTTKVRATTWDGLTGTRTGRAFDGLNRQIRGLKRDLKTYLRRRKHWVQNDDGSFSLFEGDKVIARLAAKDSAASVAS